ncbi:MAG: hypothetical protein U0527_16260 [Candidatus Eisenbacteria bacterium]
MRASRAALALHSPPPRLTVRCLLALCFLALLSPYSRGEESVPVRRSERAVPTHQEIEENRARRQALEAEVRRHPEDAAARLDLARLYLASSFLAYAEDQLERVLELDAPDSITSSARLDLGRLALNDARLRSDPARAEAAAALFYPTLLARGTLSRDALLLFAQATILSAGRRHEDGLKKAEIARAAVHTVLRAAPEDVDALLLDGLLALTLGRGREAELSFRRAIARLGAADRAQFLEDRFAVGAAGGLGDPDPTTVENEADLERWANLVRADLLYGRTDLRGWHTEPGALVARFGLPRSVLDDTFEQGQADMATTRIFGGEDPNWFRPIAESLPTRSLLYHLGGKEVLFRLEDHSMHGDWRLSADSQERVTMLAESLSTMPELRAKQTAPPLFLRTVSTRAESGKTQVDLEWARLAARAGQELDDFTLRAEVRDEHQEVVARDSVRVEGQDALRLPDGSHAQIWGRRHELEPGNYLLTLVSETGKGRRALRPLPFVARDFSGVELALGDLELAHADPSSPAYPFTRRGVVYLADPVGRVARGEAFDLLFEVYNLTRDEGGRVNIEAAYALVPLAYSESVRAAWAERADTDSVALFDAWRMGSLPRMADGTPMVTGKNYYRVSLPPEQIQTGDHPLLKVVRRFEPAASLEPGSYALLVEVRDLLAPDRPAVVGETTILLLP